MRTSIVLCQYGSVSQLALKDRYAAKRLKKLRMRSMSNPLWLQGSHVRLYLIPSSSKWEADSPLEPFRLDALRALDEFERLRKRRKPLDPAWSDVIAAVDRLIAEAERIDGQQLKWQ